MEHSPCKPSFLTASAEKTEPDLVCPLPSSNGGVFGSLYGTPIINLPQSAVLGMHAIKDRATVVDGKIEIRPIMVVALTYDHR